MSAPQREIGDRSIGDEVFYPQDDIAAVMGADGVNLQELARTAAMGAEKEAIQHALERFRWNRRKTAEYLQVSYKTLLNKMKECGISESPSS